MYLTPRQDIQSSDMLPTCPPPPRAVTLPLCNQAISVLGQKGDDGLDGFFLAFPARRNEVSMKGPTAVLKRLKPRPKYLDEWDETCSRAGGAFRSSNLPLVVTPERNTGLSHAFDSFRKTLQMDTEAQEYARAHRRRSVADGIGGRRRRSSLVGTAA